MNIVLCCSAGMSTSLLVTKMESYAEKIGEACNIWAIPGDSVRHYLHDADVILIGPHVRHMLKQIAELGNVHGIPVEIINPIHYGTFNGEEVYHFAKRLVEMES